ncbi:hypothetical protein BGY98DRAFT_988928 [Russula aff. rugulosa BPL654]|nr:hypothetical protein BGY98DRAFT_988928 [Russula aff. rugulosa BPL654]
MPVMLDACPIPASPSILREHSNEDEQLKRTEARPKSTYALLYFSVPLCHMFSYGALIVNRF